MAEEKVKKVKLKVERSGKNLKVSAVKSAKKTTMPKNKKTEMVESSIPLKKEKVNKGISIKVFGKDGKETGSVELPSELFDAKVNPKLMAQAVRVYLANQREGSASTKTRGEVRGSTRKIYRQKGTGRARHGAITAPIFVGGGIVFGPKPRDYSLKFPQKMKRAALSSALTVKRANNEVVLVDNISDIEPKTKAFNSILKSLKLSDKKRISKILFVLPNKIENLEKAARNIEDLTVEKAQNLNTYEVLVNKYILLMKDSVEVLRKNFVR